MSSAVAIGNLWRAPSASQNGRKTFSWRELRDSLFWNYLKQSVHQTKRRLAEPVTMKSTLIEMDRACHQNRKSGIDQTSKALRAAAPYLLTTLLLLWTATAAGQPTAASPA
jgi:hypothetical protein